jgi:hypothetical protein
MFLISDVTTFSKKKGKRNNLLLGGAILGTGLLGVVGVKSYLRNGKLVRQYNRNQVVKTTVKSTNVNELNSYLSNSNFSFNELFSKFNLNKIDGEYEGNLFGAIKDKYVKQHNLSKLEQTTLNKYIKHDGHDDINNYLITGDATDEVKQTVNNLNNLFDRLPKLNNSETYRYVKDVNLNDLISNYKIGSIVTEPRFTSATTNERFNDDFLNYSKVRFKIKSKSNNSNAVDIRGFNPKEEEVIFKRGTSFKINNIKQHEFTYETRSNKNKLWKGYEIEIEEV